MKVPPEERFATPEGFEQRKASEKLEWLWSKLIEPTVYRPVERPPVKLAPPTTMAKIAGRRRTLERTFDRTDDLMETDRPKIIHVRGSVARVVLETEDDSPFTGVLAPAPVGGATGLMRISLVTPTSGKNSVIPGFGLKLLVDGRPSLDTVAMNHTIGQGRDVNLFANTFTHDLRHEHDELRRPQRTMKIFFRRVAREPRFLSIDHFAETTAAGDVVADPVRPQRLLFRPDPAVRQRFRTRYVEDFRDALARIEPGSVLYSVEAVDDTVDHDRGRTIGRVRLEGPFVASRAGDRLFFRHSVTEANRVRS